MKRTLVLLGRIMHEMQKERGSVILFLCNDRAPIEEEIRQRFLESDYSVEELKSNLPEWMEKGLLNESQFEKVTDVIDDLKKLNAQRDLVLAKELSATDSIAIYSHQIIGPIISVMIEIALSDPDNDPSRVSAFSNFLNLKERIGRERALGIRGLILDSFNNNEFIENYRFLLSEQEAYKDTFLALATDEQKACYERYMDDYSIAKIDEIHEQFKKNSSNDKHILSSIDWFNLFSQKIDLMYKVKIDLIETLAKNLSQKPISNQEDKNEKSALGLKNFTNLQQEFIKTLPLFKGLTDSALSELFRNASIGQFKKGELLFMEGEQPEKLYIILEGWVKLFKGNSSGEETIVQMLTSGDMIAESAVFLNAPYPISAQVAKGAQILTLPASIIRENVKTNNDLALNVLTAMSVHSQLLIKGMESIRLKSATERVGWYLLKLLLEQGRVPDMVELPYDKSIIASYLDMKPETFSRTLKKFKQKGFEIRKDAVILPQVKALCGFCDSDVSSICSRHGTPECPNPDCISSEEIILFDD